MKKLPIISAYVLVIFVFNSCVSRSKYFSNKEIKTITDSLKKNGKFNRYNLTELKITPTIIDDKSYNGFYYFSFPSKKTNYSIYIPVIKFAKKIEFNVCIWDGKIFENCNVSNLNINHIKGAGVFNKAQLDSIDLDFRNGMYTAPNNTISFKRE